MSYIGLILLPGKMAGQSMPFNSSFLGVLEQTWRLVWGNGFGNQRFKAAAKVQGLTKGPLQLVKQGFNAVILPGDSCSLTLEIQKAMTEKAEGRRQTAQGQEL